MAVIRDLLDENIRRPILHEQPTAGPQHETVNYRSRGKARGVKNAAPSLTVSPQTGAQGKVARAHQLPFHERRSVIGNVMNRASSPSGEEPGAGWCACVCAGNVIVEIAKLNPPEWIRDYELPLTRSRSRNPNA